MVCNVILPVTASDSLSHNVQKLHTLGNRRAQAWRILQAHGFVQLQPACACSCYELLGLAT